MTKRPLLELDNVWTKVVYPSDDLYARLDYLESTLKNTGLGIYNKSFDMFMSGLTPYIVSKTDAGFRDVRVKPQNYPVVDITPGLYRDYQVSAIGKATSGHRGLLKLPTGAGKTRIIVGIANTLDKAKWLICVHKANLVDNIAATIETLTKEKCGRVHGDANDWKDKRIVVATFDSLVARKELIDLIRSCTGVIIDEVHKVPTTTAMAVLLSATNAYYRIGLSATPLIREDQRDIHTVALLGPQLHEVTVSSLVKAGHLVQPRIKWLESKLSNLKGNRGHDYDKIYDTLIAYNEDRNQEIINAELFCEKPCIIFVNKHAHQAELAKHIPARIVNEHTSIAERNEIISKLNGYSGGYDTIISTQVFSEGMDVPNLRTVINGTACSSWIQTIQELGRGTRPYPGKNYFTVYDFNDIGQEWFEEHTAQRYVAYTAAGFEVDAPNRYAKKVLKQEQVRMNLFKELSL